MKLTSKEAFLKWKKESSVKADSPKIMVGMGTCGLAAGALGVFEALEKQLQDKKSKALLTKVGCVGACHSEPSVEIQYPDGSSVLLGPVLVDNVSEILEVHLKDPGAKSRFILDNDHINAFEKGEKA